MVSYFSGTSLVPSTKLKFTAAPSLLKFHCTATTIYSNELRSDRSPRCLAASLAVSRITSLCRLAAAFGHADWPSRHRLRHRAVGRRLPVYSVLDAGADHARSEAR